MAIDKNIEDFLLYKERRKKLVEMIKSQHSSTQGVVLLSANFENHKDTFLQESSFFYFTGITEPAVVITIDIADGATTLLIPAFKGARDQWVDGGISLNSDPLLYGMDAIVSLGDAIAGYSVQPYASMDMYKNLIELLRKKSAAGSLFTLCPTDDYQYVVQRFFLSRLCTQAPEIIAKIKDISPIIAQMRRSKDMPEIEMLQQAIEITLMAHESAMESINDEINEAEVQASLEYVMTACNATPAFPSIVGAGKNSVILHYGRNSDVMHNGDLVVVDIGAQIDGYCADITRTYPVSGQFTKRQKELYDLVLKTQQYIADIAAPGYWISNAEQPEKSLQHLAKQYLQGHGGYDKYFMHGIGHFLGLDVHDVGNIKEPLRVGDVITIEPGIYIAQENIGIRIEDNYWIVKGGAVCLSEDIPKTIEDIEYAMSNAGMDDSHAGHDHGEDEECGNNIH